MSVLPSDERKIFRETASVHAIILAAGQLIASKFNLTALAAQTAYFHVAFANMNAVLKAKAQGTVVVFDPGAREGEQIKSEASPYFVFMANVLEEVIVNSALKAAMEGQVSVRDIAEMSTVFGFAKLAVEQKAASMEKERLALTARGDIAAAQAVKRRRFFLQRLFFNGVVPVLRTMTMLTPLRFQQACDRASKTTLLGFGCVALVEELRRIKGVVGVTRNGSREECARLLIAFASREE